MKWNLPSGEAFLPHVSIASLKKRAANEHNAKTRIRLLVAVQRKKGHTLESIAESLSLPKSTAQGILYRLRDNGIGSAHAIIQSGRPKRLTGKQLSNLRNAIIKPPKNNGFSEGFWNTRMVLELVKRKYGISYTGEHMTRMLAKIGYSYKKPRITNPRRASDEEVNEFKKKPVVRCWLPNEKAALPL